MIGTVVLFALAQACPDYESPQLVWSDDVPPQIIVVCGWRPDGCPQGRIVLAEDFTQPDIDGTARPGVRAVCSRVPEVPPEPPPPEPACPMTGPVQALQDEASEDMLLTCASVPEGCPALSLFIEGEPQRARARCKA